MPKMYKKNCLECGEQFVSIRNWSKFCSPTCGSANKSRRSREKEILTSPPRICIECGKSFDGIYEKFCSDECLNQYGRNLYTENTCAECGKPFVRKFRGMKYCSKRCGANVAARRYHKKRAETDPTFLPNMRKRVANRREKLKEEGRCVRCGYKLQEGVEGTYCPTCKENKAMWSLMWANR